MINIKKGDWVLLYVIFGTIDFVEIMIAWTGIGMAISAGADLFIGIFFAWYLHKKNFSVFRHPSVLISLVGGTLLGAITGGIAPAWVVDVWIIKKIATKEQKKYEDSRKQGEFIQANVRKPLYENGMRRPQIESSSEEQPLYMDGIRAPNGGLRQ